jgi:alpha-L-rhamnosidase
MKGKEGTRVTIRHGEMLNTDTAYQNAGEKRNVKGGDGPPGTLYRKNLRNLRGPIASDCYIFKGDETVEYTPRFTYHGFRYVEISGIDSPPESVIAIAISSDNIQTCSFETSHPKVNKLYSNIYWTMRSNFVSIPTDSPSRDDRFGLTGDAQIFSGTSAYLSDNDQFYSKWLQDLRSYQMNEETSDRDKGLVSVVSPAVRSSGLKTFSNSFSDAAVIIPWLLYQHYGDTRILSESYNSMKSWCDFLNSAIRSKDFILLTKEPRDSSYGDWMASHITPHDLTDTLATAYSNKILSKIAKIIGKKEDAVKYEDISNKIYEAFKKRFENGDGSIINDSQTAYAMLLYFDFAEENKKPILIEKLRDNIRSRGWKLSTGIIGTEYLCPALSQNKASEVAFKLLEQEECPSWFYMIDQGATTIWERWNGYTPEYGFNDYTLNSFNHFAFGSIGEWLFSGILGMRRVEEHPGFRQFILDPQYGGTLTYAKGHFNSVCGRIESSWTLDHNNNLFLFNCTVPPNSRATLYMPANEPKKVKEGGIPAYEAKGIEYVGFNSELKREVFILYSGNYSFSSIAAPTVKLN